MLLSIYTPSIVTHTPLNRNNIISFGAMLILLFWKLRCFVLPKRLRHVAEECNSSFWGLQSLSLTVSAPTFVFGWFVNQISSILLVLSNLGYPFTAIWEEYSGMSKLVSVPIARDLRSCLRRYENSMGLRIAASTTVWLGRMSQEILNCGCWGSIHNSSNAPQSAELISTDF